MHFPGLMSGLGSSEFPYTAHHNNMWSAWSICNHRLVCESSLATVPCSNNQHGLLSAITVPVAVAPAPELQLTRVRKMPINMASSVQGWVEPSLWIKMWNSWTWGSLARSNESAKGNWLSSAFGDPAEMQNKSGLVQYDESRSVWHHSDYPISPQRTTKKHLNNAR